MTIGHAIIVFLLAVFLGLVVYWVSGLVAFLRAYKQQLAIGAFGLVILFGLLFPLLDVHF